MATKGKGSGQGKKGAAAVKKVQTARSKKNGRVSKAAAKRPKVAKAVAKKSVGKIGAKRVATKGAAKKVFAKKNSVPKVVKKTAAKKLVGKRAQRRQTLAPPSSPESFKGAYHSSPTKDRSLSKASSPRKQSSPKKTSPTRSPSPKKSQSPSKRSSPIKKWPLKLQLSPKRLSSPFKNAGSRKSLSAKDSPAAKKSPVGKTDQPFRIALQADKPSPSRATSQATSKNGTPLKKSTRKTSQEPRKARQMEKRKGMNDALAALRQYPEVSGVIALTVNHKPKKDRRPRNLWSMHETKMLEMGVAKHGAGNWQLIQSDYFGGLEGPRTVVDLKDKWRNLHHHKPYAAHKMRTFTVLDFNHRPVKTENGNLHVFRNRWPRDAALKAASRSEFYPSPMAHTAIVYVKEILPQEEKDLSIVHVFKATRRPEYNIPDIGRFTGYTKSSFWKVDVEKVREEIFVPAEYLQKLLARERGRVF